MNPARLAPAHTPTPRPPGHPPRIGLDGLVPQVCMHAGQLVDVENDAGALWGWRVQGGVPAHVLQRRLAHPSQLGRPKGRVDWPRHDDVAVGSPHS